MSEDHQYVSRELEVHAKKQSTQRSEIVRRIKQTACLMVMVLAYACGLSLRYAPLARIFHSTQTPRVS